MKCSRDREIQTNDSSGVGGAYWLRLIRDRTMIALDSCLGLNTAVNTSIMEHHSSVCILVISSITNDSSFVSVPAQFPDGRFPVNSQQTPSLASMN